MDKYIKFTDFFQASIVQTDADKKNKDFFSLLFPSGGRKHRTSHEDLTDIPKILGVNIAATHSGKVTENNSVYLPDKMRDGTVSWLEPFPKPILLHHDKQDDAIGRVRNAKYVDLSQGFRRDTGWIKKLENVKHDQYQTSDVLIDAFLDGKLSPRESVDVIKNVLLVRDTNYTKDPSFEGLGYIELQAAITDPDAIKKIIDERYLTGSIGARASAAICSICKKDWVKEGWCEHNPGQEYDGILCVIVAGELLYDEYSYVNRPADVHSRNLEIFADGKLIDSREVSSKGDSGQIPEVWFNFDDSITEFPQQKDGADLMTRDKWLEILKDKKLEGLTEDFKLEDLVDQVLLKVEDISDELFKNKEGLIALAEKNLKSYLEKEEEKEDKKEEDKKEDDKKELEGVDLLKSELGDEYDDLMGEDPQDGDIHYVGMVADAMAGRDIPADEAKLFLEAKLSAEQRKKLSASTFCGPERSFPVNDCAHYTAALRLLGKYKGPGDKEKIRDCILRKGKRMKCSDSKKDKKDSIGIFLPDYFDFLSDDELVQMYNGNTKALQERGLSHNECTEIQNTIQSLEEENQKLKDSQEDNKNDLDPKKAELELQAALTTQSQLQKELIEAFAENKNIRASHIVAFQVLSGKSVEDKEQVISELLAKEDKELTEIEDQLCSSIDVEKLNDLLSQGLARDPKTGVVVSDPTLGYTKEGSKSSDADKNKIDEKRDEKKQELTKEFMDEVVSEFIKIRMTQGQKAAAEYLEMLKEKNMIPREFPMPKDNKDKE